MGTHPVRDAVRRQLPDFLGLFAVILVGNHHIRRQSMGESAHFTGGAAGGGLAGQGEGTVARGGDLAGQAGGCCTSCCSPRHRECAG